MADKTVLTEDIATLDRVEEAAHNLAVATQAAQKLLGDNYYQQPRFLALVAPAEAVLARLTAALEKEAVPRKPS